MIRIADRHIGTTAIGGMLVALIALVAMDVFFATIAELGDVGKGNYSTSQALWYVFLTLPRRVYDVFPVAGVVGTMIAVGGLAASSELTAYRAAGMSRQRIATGVVLATIAILTLVIALGELIAPRTEKIAQALRIRAQSTNVAIAGDASVWIRDGNRLINAKRPLATAAGEEVRLADIDIFEFQGGKLETLAHADLAVHDGERWRLDNVRRSIVSLDKVEVAVFDVEYAATLVEPSVLSTAITRPRYLALTELLPYVEYLDRNGLDAATYRAALWRRLAYPITAVVAVFAGMVFVFSSNRAGGLGQRLFLGMLIGVVFYLANRIAITTAEAYDVSTWFMALAPNALFAGLSLYFLRRGT